MRVESNLSGCFKFKCYHESSVNKFKKPKSPALNFYISTFNCFRNAEQTSRRPIVQWIADHKKQKLKQVQVENI